MKRQGKFPWEHHELAWISFDYLLRGENDSKQSDEFQANHELHWENNWTIVQAKNYNHNPKP